MMNSSEKLTMSIKKSKLEMASYLLDRAQQNK